MCLSRWVRLAPLGLSGFLLCVVAAELSHSGTAVKQDPFTSLKISRLQESPPLATFDLKSLDGQTVHSTDLTDKVVLLNFWATWCGPCKDEMPSLARLQQRLDPQRFRVVTVTADLHPTGIKQFLAQLGISLPVLFDEDQEVSRLFMVRGLPTTVLLAKDGRAIGRAVGPRAWDSETAVDLMLRVYEGAK